MTITLYAIFDLDTTTFGRRLAACSPTKPTHSHAEYAMYRIEAKLADNIEYRCDYGPQVCADLSDYTNLAPAGSMAWFDLTWHTADHRVYITDTSGTFFPLKGCHVTHWEEI